MKKFLFLVISMLMLMNVSNGQDWEVKNYVDEFGDKTSSEYVGGNVGGTFSNSATENSPLKVFAFVDKTSVTFDLYEYRSSPASMESCYGTLNIKTETGDVFKLSCFQYKKSLYFSRDKYEVLMGYVKKYKRFKCVYKEVSDYGSAVYKFNIATGNIIKLVSNLNK